MATILKRVLCPQRLRRVPSQFSWLDHRLVRDRHICRCSHPALALYLFLVTVCDGQGLSYYSDASIGRLLRLDGAGRARARRELIDAGLIAFASPLYQVLALGPAAEPAAPTATVRLPAAVSPSPSSAGQLPPTPASGPQPAQAIRGRARPQPAQAPREPTEPSRLEQILRRLMESSP